MPAAIEDTVEIHGIKFPTRGHGGDVLIETGDEGDMAGAGFRGHACM